MNEQRNMVFAILLSALVLIGGTFLSEKFFPQPKPKPGATAQTDASSNSTTAQTPVRPAPVIDTAKALQSAPRIAIETPTLKGSLSLVGARLDDLVLLQHKVTSKKDSEPVRLLSPAGTKRAYLAGFGWTGDGIKVPDSNTLWTANAQMLTPDQPLALRWANGQGQEFLIILSVDKSFMFNVEQKVINGGASAVSVRPNGYVSRAYGIGVRANVFSGTTVDQDSWTIHVGPIGTFNGKTNYEIDYATLDGPIDNAPRFNSSGGWIGFGDTYWLAALAPAKGANVDTGFRKAGNSYMADFSTQPVIVAPGKAVTTKTHFFAGAKEVEALDGYEEKLGIANFGKAIDWGWFEIFAKPVFYLLHALFKMVGNFGFAIILLTLIVKGIMFPIAQRQFASMAKMRVVQPKMKALQERYKDDKQKLQQEMLALYQKEKINPAGGCLPIFIQMPIFYALYKVLMLSIEMRHQPFIGWIKDLSAPDPLTPVNLFGLLDFQPPALLALGVLPILLGITMYYQFKLNPQQMDPVQQQVFAVMPWFLMFIMAPFAAGLQLYWVVNNTLTILQQQWLYRQYPMPAEPAKT